MRHVDFTHPPSEASAVIKQRHVSEPMYPCTKDLCRMNLDTFAPVDLCICCNCCKTECQNCMALLLVPKGLFTASCFRGSSRRHHQQNFPWLRVASHSALPRFAPPAVCGSPPPCSAWVPSPGLRVPLRAHPFAVTSLLTIGLEKAQGVLVPPGGSNGLAALATIDP